MMSRNSDKLNVINYQTFEKLQAADELHTPKQIRNAKYKNKHKKQQLSLLDYVSNRKPQKKSKKVQVPRRKCTNKIKHKGKVRLILKPRTTRLKKLIRNIREIKIVRRAQIESLISESVDSQSQFQDSNALKCDETPLGTLLYELKLTETSEAAPVSEEPTNSKSIHSRRFRSYCDHCTVPRLTELTNQLLRDLNRFQTRAHAVNEIKARAHRRFVIGFREAESNLRINKVKLLIIATDCEICPIEGGLDDIITKLKNACQKQNVPYCFPCARRKLAYSLYKRAQISCVAVLDYDGVNASFNELLKELTFARNEYVKITSS